jgi:MFS family permease
LFQFLNQLLFSIPIITLFLQDNGLSVTEVMLLQSVFSVIIVLLEVPSGYFSDIFGRKKTLIISSFFSLLGIIFYSLGASF